MTILDVEIERRAIEAVRFISDLVAVRAAYLFGSQLTGKTDESSDIDVAVFAEQARDLDLARRADLALLIHEKVGRDIEVHYFPSEYLTAPPPASFAAYVLKHGHPLKMGAAES